MGITMQSSTKDARINTRSIEKKEESDLVVALVGNPNVGKSTVFNALTGMHQHTGNWTGKTVSMASGYVKAYDRGFCLVDLPGCYSLFAHSREEEVARDFILEGNADAVIVVCDGTCLERNLILALQILCLTKNVVLCVNLLDEAKKKHIEINLKKLEELLGIPVIGTTARKKKGLSNLLRAVLKIKKRPPADVWNLPENAGRSEEETAREIVRHAEEISRTVKNEAGESAYARDRRVDRILTSKAFGFPIMFLMLLGIFWLTIEGANYPSSILSEFLFRFETPLLQFLDFLPAPLPEVLVLGAYRVTAWVVSVMLPPMAIFFPLFTLLEDLGYLPRVAFNLDKCFKKCRACGKQALTMCMGFGCNAAGVVGCRIIDSPRERLIAILTNSFVPCNGRFPFLVAVLTMFFAGSGSVLSAVGLAGFIVLGVLITLLVSYLLSVTILKGVPSSFTLELPSYRRPQIGSVIVRSVFDRTIFVLGRALVSAAPCGILIWICANVMVGDASILKICTDFLNPFASLFGLDGVILMAFILGLPANEIVLPIIVMAYMSGGTLTGMEDLIGLKALLSANGWTAVTAICTMLFSLMHWPCATTLLTVRKETGSLWWTVAAFLIPTIVGFTACFLVNTIENILL
ncbi:MAG: ferrous iron transporter B [Clostridia bacterium]|nr:ferrous iron transporter B [Clostridia bacterium]